MNLTLMDGWMQELLVFLLVETPPIRKKFKMFDLLLKDLRNYD